MRTVEEQVGRLFAEMEAEQAPIRMDEIVGDSTVEDSESVSTPRRFWMLVAAAVLVFAVGAAFVLAARSGDDPAPVETPPVPSTTPTSTLPLVIDSVGADPRSYFSVDDALEYAGGPIRIGDGRQPASRDEMAELLAGGEGLEGTDTDVRPSLFYVHDSEQEGAVERRRPLLSAECPPTLNPASYGGFLGLEGGGGYPPGLVGAFQMAADGGIISPDWVYVDWYDDDLTYEEAKVLFDEAVLSWIISRGYVGGRGYSGSKIAVTLSPDPAAPWNQAVIDHPFLRPAVVGDDLVDAVCETFNGMDPL